MKVTYGITVHNEKEYIRELLTQLTTHIEKRSPGDEIVVLDDFSAPETATILDEFAQNKIVSVYKKKFERDFATHKNYLNKLCDGDYIFQVDADELFSDYLLTHVHMIIESNKKTDLFLIPRINTVEGLTDEHIKKWGWLVNEKGWVNWPDFQTRLYRNSHEIRWEGKVHERIRGYKIWSALPDQPEFALIHKKTIDRQEKQNELYSAI